MFYFKYIDYFFKPFENVKNFFDRENINNLEPVMSQIKLLSNYFT